MNFQVFFEEKKRFREAQYFQVDNRYLFFDFNLKNNYIQKKIKNLI